MPPLFFLFFFYLDEHFPQEGHDIRGIHAAESSDCADGQLSDLKNLIIQCDKQRLEVLSLGQVSVEALVKGGQNTVPDVWICGRKEVRTFFTCMILRAVTLLKTLPT